MFGKNSSTPLWPIHLKPFDGELLSSWLVRLSTAHGLKPYIFLSAIWSPNLWNQRDIDRITNRAFFELIAERTGTTLSRVLATSLAEYQGRIFEVHSSGGITPWIIPRDNMLISKPIYFGLQYCPLCLLEDKQPYFRRQWRLACVVYCVKHKVSLLDRCAKCSGAINFYLNTQRDECKGNGALTTCFNCKFDLREAVPKIDFTPDIEALNFQKDLSEAAEQAWAEIPNIGPIYSLLFFEGLRNLAYALVARHPKANNILRGAVEYFGIQAATPDLPRKATFESLGIETRRAAFLVMEKLLNNWPDEFINFNKAINVEIDVWDRKNLKVAPAFWYWNVVNLKLRKPKYTPSDQEIESILKYFRKTGQEATRRELRKYLNYNRVHRTMRNKGLVGTYKYPESVRRNAVRSVLRGRKYKDVAQSLNVCEKTIRIWVKAHHKSQ